MNLGAIWINTFLSKSLTELVNSKEKCVAEEKEVEPGARDNPEGCINVACLFNTDGCSGYHHTCRYKLLM